VSVETLEFIWSKQLEAVAPLDSSEPTDASAYGCAVYGDFVYLAGVVKDGAAMISPSDPQQSYGMDDLFVAQLEASSGEIQWVNQIGTSKNERLGAGGAITVDPAGNVILLGQTEGSLYRVRGETDDAGVRKLKTTSDNNTSELIVFSMSQEGSFQAPVVEPTETYDSAPIEPAAPVEPAPVAAAPTKAPTAPTTSKSAIADDEESSWEDNKSLWIALIAVGGSILFCCLCLICLRARKQNEDDNNQRKMLSIFKYLHAFDVDDIDIRRSPAGGYHGTYLNDLAHGENIASGEETEKDSISTNSSSTMRPNLSHSTVVDDYMFMSKRVITKNVADDDDSATGLSARV
jgi:hypothetical protein